MTENDFRRLALSLPEAVESAHMGHPDGGWAMVKLPPDQQEAFVCALPDVFVPVKGTWRLQGATNVRLARAKET